jgi:hypothetical protein
MRPAVFLLLSWIYTALTPKARVIFMDASRDWVSDYRVWCEELKREKGIARILKTTPNSPDSR